MTFGIFPEDHNARRVVLILPKNEFDRCGYEHGVAADLMRPDVSVVQYEQTSKLPQYAAWRNIVDFGLYRTGALLIQSPFDPDVYDNADHAHQRFALAKHMHFSTLCALLGAKSVVVSQVETATVNSSQSGKIGIAKGPVKLGAEVIAERKQAFKASLNLKDAFPGGLPQIEHAEQHLRKHSLWGDQNMRGLIDLRRNPAKWV